MKTTKLALMLKVCLIMTLGAANAAEYVTKPTAGAVEQEGLYKQFKTKAGRVTYHKLKPNSSSEACKHQAALACHPSWGSLPIGSLPDVPGCGFYHLEKRTDANGNLYYEIGSVFDGTQVKENVWICPKGIK